MEIARTCFAEKTTDNLQDGALLDPRWKEK